MATTDKILIDDFMAYMKPKSSARTLYQYQQDLFALLDFLGDSALTHIGQTEMNKFIYKPKASGEAVKPATAKRRLMELRTLDKWMYEVAEIIPKNRAKLIESPKVNNIRPKPIADPDWKKLWFAGLNDDVQVALALGYFFGLRREEIVKLTPKQFVFEPTLMIVDAQRKGGKVIDVPIFSTLQLFEMRRRDLIGGIYSVLTPLRRLLKEREGKPLLLPWIDNVPSQRINPDSFTRRMRRLSCRYKLSEVVTPHMLRHAFGTNLVQMNINPIDIARLMSHSSMTTTMRYVQSGSDPLKKYLEESQHSDGEEHPRW